MEKDRLSDEQQRALDEWLANHDARPPQISKGVDLWDNCLRLEIPVGVLDRAYTRRTGKKPL